MKYKVLIDNEEYIDADIRSANIERPLFDQLSIGNACEATLKIVFRKKNGHSNNGKNDSLCVS